MSRARLKKSSYPLTLNSEYTEYTLCLRCRRVNRIEIGHGYGISHELHERGSCLLVHPNWLDGRYSSYEEAAAALRVKLGRWDKRRGRNQAMGDGAKLSEFRRDRRSATPGAYFGPERRRRIVGLGKTDSRLGGGFGKEAAP
ncbi:MAG: hypothetical protein FIA97_09745 [Methylococcaceae bacterium]|nr:hypothetical protein [Methylococcaceae bacterium]